MDIKLRAKSAARKRDQKQGAAELAVSTTSTIVPDMATALPSTDVTVPLL